MFAFIQDWTLLYKTSVFGERKVFADAYFLGLVCLLYFSNIFSLPIYKVFCAETCCSTNAFFGSNTLYVTSLETIIYFPFTSQNIRMYTWCKISPSLSYVTGREEGKTEDGSGKGGARQRRRKGICLGMYSITEITECLPRPPVAPFQQCHATKYRRHVSLRYCLHSAHSSNSLW
jgi:hypothetical protein